MKKEDVSNKHDTSFFIPYSFKSCNFAKNTGMDSIAIIEQIIKSEKGLTSNEIEKCRGEYDKIYFDDRIDFHQKLASRQKRTFYAIVFFSILAFLVLSIEIFANPNLIVWFRGIIFGYFIAIGVLMPRSIKNHSRIASTLTHIKFIKENI